MEDFELFDGDYTGSWYTSQEENPGVISQGFSRNNGKAKFRFDFTNRTDFGTQDSMESHVSVLGNLYSGEFSSEEVEIEFKISPSYSFTVDNKAGSILVQEVNVTLVKKSETTLLDIDCKAYFYNTAYSLQTGCEDGFQHEAGCDILRQE
jgi:hypothetical protein